MNSCWIVGAGEFCESDFAPLQGDYVIAADGGYSYLQHMGAKCDMVLGDFDSLGFVPDHPNVVRHNPIKDDPDMMLAVHEGEKRGFKRFYLLGGMGGRIAHSLANVQTLIYLSRHGCACYLVGTCDEITAVTNGALEFSEKANGYLSVFCLDGKAEGIYMNGLKYTLDDGCLVSDRPLGLSNEFTGRGAHIYVRKGTLVAVYAKRPENRAVRVGSK